MGFSLRGDGDIGDSGIHVAAAWNAPIEDLVIKGGRISGFQHGLRCDYVNNSRIEKMVVSRNANYGVSFNGFQGQCDGNSIRENTITKNTNRGIALYYADGNRIEANHVSGTTGASSYGIRTANSENNFILKNTCVGQVNNLSLDPHDTYGPIVTNTGALAGTDPWANFSR